MPRGTKLPPIRRARAPIDAHGVKNHANVSAKGDRLIHKLEGLRNIREAGTFSISFQNTGGGGWLGSLIGIRALDKLEHDLEGGRKMKVFLMVRVTGGGMKLDAEGRLTKRVPAFGVKPIIADSIADVEALLKTGPKKSKAAYKEHIARRKE